MTTPLYPVNLTPARTPAEAMHPLEIENVTLRKTLSEAIDERNAAILERDEARAMLSSICSEFEGVVAHADWRAAGSPGMSVPFKGDFASATQLPSVVGRMRWWAREMRKTINTALASYEAEEIVRATPLVTEVDK